MKKTLALLLAVMLSVTMFAGCGNGNNDVSSEPVSQHSIPQVSAPTVLTSTKFTMDITPATDWDKSTTNAELCFSLVCLGADAGRTITGYFKGTLADGETVDTYAKAYQDEMAITFSDAKWSDPVETKIGGYPTLKTVGEMGFEGVSNKKEFICYWINVEGEVFSIILQQDLRLDGSEYDNTAIDQMMDSVTFTPIA